MKIRWFLQARKDLDALFSYIARDSISAAEKEAKRVTNAVAGLEANPAIGRPGRVAETRELVIAPYIIAYRVKPGSIQILRVMHSAMDWPKLL